MNKINPLFEAMSNIDDKIASAAIKEKRKRPIALIIAAAAAMTLLTGFTVRILTSDDPGVNVNYENLFNYNIIDKKDLNILTKDELQEMGAIERGNFEYGTYTFLFEDALPSEILKLYNADPITLDNDNFTEEPSDVYVHGMFDKDNFEFSDFNFDYTLVHKETGEKISVSCIYSIDRYQPSVSHSYDNKTQEFTTKVIDLNDGSKCMIDEVSNKGYEGIYSGADFSYDGAVYLIDSNSGEMDMDGMKQILADLGVL